MNSVWKSLLVVFRALAEIIGWFCFDRFSFDLCLDDDLCLRALGRPNGLLSRWPSSASTRLTVVSVLLPNLVLGCAEFIAFDFARVAGLCHSCCSGAKNCSRSPQKFVKFCTNSGRLARTFWRPRNEFIPASPTRYLLDPDDTGGTLDTSEAVISSFVTPLLDLSVIGLGIDFFWIRYSLLLQFTVFKMSKRLFSDKKFWKIWDLKNNGETFLELERKEFNFQIPFCCYLSSGSYIKVFLTNMFPRNTIYKVFDEHKIILLKWLT